MIQANETRAELATRATKGTLNTPTGSPNENATQRLLAVRIFAAVWVAFLLLVPLRYYALGDHDPYDERFAWRMFSAVRVQECETHIEETRFGEETATINAQTTLPAPWLSLLQRNRPAVVESFLNFRCESSIAPTSVSVRSACTDVTGVALAPVTRRMTCETRAIETTQAGSSAAEPHEGSAP